MAQSSAPFVHLCLVSGLVHHSGVLLAVPEEAVAQKSMQLGAFGVWNFQLDVLPAARMQETAAELEELGYGALWFGEATGREALTKAALLLAGTKRMVIATGIANIYGRDPVTMSAAQKTLAEAYPNRFLLGGHSDGIAAVDVGDAGGD